MRRATALAAAPLAFALALGTAPAASAHDVAHLPARSATPPLPLVTSPNVSLVTSLPETTAISMEFSPSAPFAYVSSLDTISVLDIKDPKAPKLRGTLVNAMFQNEAMTYGERTSNGKTTRFVLAGIDLYQASPADPVRRNLGGREVAVVDVTDPDKPFFRGRVRAGTSTHTVQCVSQQDCTFAYTAGEGGGFSILDLTDLDAPKQVTAKHPSPASGPNAVFSSGAGHYWDFVDSVVTGKGGTPVPTRVGWHTGSGGAAAFDVTNPAKPTLITTTTAAGKTAGLNDFILHNSLHPNAAAFRPDAAPSFANGNVLLVAEEDYANDGDELACDRAGGFQTWHIKRLDGSKDGVEPLDSKTIAQLGGGLTTPAAAFCSAHFFDVHQDGYVAHAFYGAGLRILDVDDPKRISQIGFVTSGATEVWDAYFVPAYTSSGRATDRKTNVVYTTDAVRGVEVYEVTFPARGQAAAAPGRASSDDRSLLSGAGTLGGSAAAGLPAGLPGAVAALAVGLLVLRRRLA